MTREELKVKSGIEYDHYFPKAMGGTETQKKGATVSDTIRFIPKVVKETEWQTKRFANEVIKADNLYNTCKNLWEFVFNHIAYRKDEDGKEQVRSPARAWRDRHSGVDCDCYTVFISSILSNLKIKHVLRITKYGEDHFQHIYPIVPLANGKYITIDCVVKQFNYEEPYTEKKDTTMDLEYLNGTTSAPNKENQYSEDLMGMMGEREAMMELGKLFKRKASSSGSSGGAKKGLFQRKTAEQKKERRAKVKKFLNKGLHLTNRFNPATATLRAGILASMKLNFMKIASELKYTYLTDEEASKRGLDMGRFPKMKRVREKLEKLFYGAGGKPENLKKAILTGKANKDKSIPVNGLGYAPYENVDGLHEDLPLSQLLGSSMYSSEGMNEVNGLGEVGELGEPATAATIAAATTVLTTIVALIKSVGSLVPKKKGNANSENSSSGENNSASENNSSSESGSSSENNSSESSNDNSSNQSSENNASSDNETTNGSSQKSNQPAKTNSSSSENTTTESDEENGNASAQRNATTSEKTTNTKKESFWDKHKKWLKPTGIAVGSVGLIALAYQLFKPKKEVKKASPVNGTEKKTTKTKNNHLLNGLKSKAKKTTKASHNKTHRPKKKSAVTLM